MDVSTILAELFKQTPMVALLAVVAWLQYRQNKADRAKRDALSEQVLEIQKETSKEVLRIHQESARQAREDQERHARQMIEIQQEGHRVVEELKDEHDKRMKEVHDEHNGLTRAFMDKMAEANLKLAAAVGQQGDRFEAKLDAMANELRKTKALVSEQLKLVPQR